MSKPLNPRNKLFCKLYASPDRQFFGNGAESYKEVYDKVDDSTARANASALLTKPNILEEINRLLDMEGFNDAFADKQLLFLMTQNADFRAKLSAIAEYNKLKTRITQKMDHTSKGESIGGFNYLIPKKKKKVAKKNDIPNAKAKS